MLFTVTVEVIQGFFCREEVGLDRWASIGTSLVMLQDQQSEMTEGVFLDVN